MGKGSGKGEALSSGKGSGKVAYQASLSGGKGSGKGAHPALLSGGKGSGKGANPASLTGGKGSGKGASPASFSGGKGSEKGTHPASLSGGKGSGKGAHSASLCGGKGAGKDTHPPSLSGGESSGKGAHPALLSGGKGSGKGASPASFSGGKGFGKGRGGGVAALEPGPPVPPSGKGRGKRVPLAPPPGAPITAYNSGVAAAAAGDREAAADLFGRAASRGHAQAAHNLALLETEADPKGATALLRSAAAMVRHRSPHTSTGQPLYTSKPSHHCALWRCPLCICFAPQGLAEAQFALGLRLIEGAGITGGPRLGEARLQLERAVDNPNNPGRRPHARASFELGRLLERGGPGATPDGLPDEAGAKRHYRVAAAAGVDGACVHLGRLLERSGRAEERGAAADAYAAAAGRGDPTATFNLAMCHAGGTGGAAKDGPRALELLATAAAKAHPKVSHGESTPLLGGLAAVQ